MDRNQLIGADNDLPWHLPKDLQFFKQKTTGNTIVMGRKTFESIGRVLPNRKNIVLTRNKNLTFPEGVEVIHDVKEIEAWQKKHPQDELFIIGGGNLIKQMLPAADRMYITWIDHRFEGDVFFPAFSDEEWALTSKVKGEKDEKNPYDYYFLQYDRKSKQ